MATEECLDGPRVRLCGIRRCQSLLERKKILAVRNHETIVRKRDNVGSLSARELEPNRHSSRRRVRRAVWNGGIGRAVGEANRYRRRSILKMCGAGNCSSALRRYKCSLADNPLSMHRPEARMISRNLKHHLGDLLA